MLKIKKFEVANFRGIKSPISLEFTKGKSCTSALLYGRNGTGKSSFVDAWEWLCSREFVINHLNKEGVTAKDYPHRSCKGKDCFVTLEFEHPVIKNLSIRFDKAKTKTPTTGGQFSEFKELAIYPNFLRSADLYEFVYLSKTDKYKYIAKFFGLDEFSNKQGFLQTGLTRITRLVEDTKKSTKQNIAQLVQLTGNATNDADAIVEAANRIAVRQGLNEIKSFGQLATLRDELNQKVRDNPVAHKLSIWKIFSNEVSKFYPLRKLAQRAKELDAAYAELIKDETSLTKLLLLDVYDVSIAKLGKMDDRTTCPLCDKKFDGDLLSHIESKHAQLSALHQTKQQYELKRQELLDGLKSLGPKCDAILQETNPEVHDVLTAFFALVSKVRESLDVLLSSIDSLGAETQDLGELSKFQLVDDLSDLHTEVVTTISGNISTLSSDSGTALLAQDFESIGKLQSCFSELTKNKAKFRYLARLERDLNKFWKTLTGYIRQEIAQTFAKIESEVMDCFDILEAGNSQFKNPRIQLVEGKDKAIELEIEFIDEKVMPAFKFMSESQVNSFGLSIFLAAVKHFNPQFKFIILDDIINSFDDYKRPRIQSLIASRFSDFQFLVLTHDQIFFDTMQRSFPEWQRYRFTQWDYYTGPRYVQSKNYLEEIQEYLDNDNPITAGQTLGRYLEWVFGMVNENLKTAIPYRINNNHTLADFYNPLVSRLKKKVGRANTEHPLINLLDSLDQGDIFRNYCAHWKNETAPMSTPELRSIFDTWVKIEDWLFCPGCKSFIHLDESGGKSYIRCTCADLNVVDDRHYTAA